MSGKKGYRFVCSSKTNQSRVKGKKVPGNKEDASNLRDRSYVESDGNTETKRIRLIKSSERRNRDRALERGGKKV